MSFAKIRVTEDTVDEFRMEDNIDLKLGDLRNEPKESEAELVVRYVLNFYDIEYSVEHRDSSFVHMFCFLVELEDMDTDRAENFTERMLKQDGNLSKVRFYEEHPDNQSRR